MDLPVYDFRTDIKNLLVTPQIRSRFLKMAVGQFNEGHTHDLGHEIFLILQGQAEFNIAGRKAVVGPGQLCIALVDEWHSVENVGDDEVIMYLSVTPHIQPTHTRWYDDDTKMPPTFRPDSDYDVVPDHSTPTATLVDRCVEKSATFAAAVETHTTTLNRQAEAVKRALLADDQERGRAARDSMWAAFSDVYSSLADFSSAWNEFGARTEDEEYEEKS